MDAKRVVEDSLKAVEEYVVRAFREKFQSALYTDVENAQKAEALAVAETAKAKQATEHERRNVNALEVRAKELTTELRDLQAAVDGLRSEHAGLLPKVVALRKEHAALSTRFRKFAE